VTVRNVTFSLPVDLLRRAEMLAAENDTSLNALVKDALTQTIDRSEYRAAGERLLELARKPMFEIPDPVRDRSELDPTTTSA
jgi:predicted transcriptional regulator